MRGISITQALIGVVLLAAFTVAAVLIADSWADWVVFGAFIFTFLGFAVAVHKRQYPTKKRAFTRDSESNW
jgi:hypothetical protein